MAIQILQCGAGLRGNHWAQFVRAHPDVECVGVIDVDPAALDQIKAKVQHESCRYFTDLDQALAETKADAVLIVSPSALHASQAIRCMAAGLTVMVEKPFGTSVAEAKTVLERARTLKKQVIVAENYRFFPAERTFCTTTAPSWPALIAYRTQRRLQRAAHDHRADQLVTGQLQRLDDADAARERRAAARHDALFDGRARRVQRVLHARRGAQR